VMSLLVTLNSRREIRHEADLSTGVSTSTASRTTPKFDSAVDFNLDIFGQASRSNTESNTNASTELFDSGKSTPGFGDV